jgi:hypothetical protein
MGCRAEEPPGTRVYVTRLRHGYGPEHATLYHIPGEHIEDGAATGGARAGYQAPPADQVTAEQVREWAFHGWCALIDLDKYLRRGSLWEAHYRLNQARDQVWALWAAATGAIYPWHGLSQVLDNDPDRLPPGIGALRIQGDVWHQLLIVRRSMRRTRQAPAPLGRRSGAGSSSS